MNNMRQTTRIDTRYMVRVRPGTTKASDDEIRAMIINISLDGALIETAEQLTCRSLVLKNTYKKETVSIHAKVVHHQDVKNEDRVFGSHRTGLFFMNNIDAAKEFIISIVKSQESEAEEYTKELGTPPEWMDTGQINLALFSTDTYSDDVLNEEDLELPEKLEPLSERSSWVEQDSSALEKAPEEPMKVYERFKKPDEPPTSKTVSPPKPETPPPSDRAMGKSSFKPMSEPMSPPPESQKNDKRRSLPVVPIITAGAVIGLVALILIFRSPIDNPSGNESFWGKLGIDIPFLHERPLLPQGDTPVFETTDSDLPAHLMQDSIQGAIVDNEKLGPLFVIRGFLKLQPGHRVEEVNVRGKVYDEKKDLISSMTIWPGNQVDDDQIALFDRNDLIKISNFSPNRGFYSRVPFVMVFSDLPNNTSSFSVDLTFIKL